MTSMQAIVVRCMQLVPAIQQGLVSVATIDDKVRRILRVAIKFGWLDREQTDLAFTTGRTDESGQRSGFAETADAR